MKLVAPNMVPTSTIEHAVAGGTAISSLLLVEYAPEPVRSGLFRKLSVFRIGNVYFGANFTLPARAHIQPGVRVSFAFIPSYLCSFGFTLAFA